MHPDDYAGYLTYLGMIPFLLLISGLYAVRNRWLLKTGMPKMKTVLGSLAVSSMLMAVPWILLAAFFDRHRFDLPGDGNWPAISVMTGLAAFHIWLLLALPQPTVIPVITGADGKSESASQTQ